ncbi:MAG: hypothetical protein P1R58_04170 [bacterium]|nr:hypothetical protein [bacterium]
MSSNEPHGKMGYEKKDVSTRKIISWAVGLTLLVVLFVVMLNELFTFVSEEVITEQVRTQDKATLSELRVVEDSILNSYGWSDSTKTSYRIPLDSAIELVAREAQSGK